MCEEMDWCQGTDAGVKGGWGLAEFAVCGCSLVEACGEVLSDDIRAGVSSEWRNNRSRSAALK